MTALPKKPKLKKAKLKAKLPDVPDVRDFGAKGDGKRDDREDFARAIKAVPAGRCLGISPANPGKHYCLGSGLEIGKDFRLEGRGQNPNSGDSADKQTPKIKLAPDAVGFKVGSASGARVQIGGICVEGGKCALQISGDITNGSIFERFLFCNQTDTAIKAAPDANMTGVRFGDFEIRGANQAVHLQGYCGQTLFWRGRIIDTRCDSYDEAVLIEASGVAGNVVFDHFVTESNRRRALTVKGVNVTLRNHHCEANGSAAGGPWPDIVIEKRVEGSQTITGEVYAERCVFSSPSQNQGGVRVKFGSDFSDFIDLFSTWAPGDKIDCGPHPSTTLFSARSPAGALPEILNRQNTRWSRLDPANSLLEVEEVVMHKRGE